MIMDLNPLAGGADKKGAPKKSIDTANHFAVGVNGADEIVILRPKCGPMTKAEAANMAKWLHVLSGESAADFARGCKEIQSS